MLNLQDLMRGGSVKRWHMINTSRVPTLAEHQCNVALLVEEFGNRLGWEPLKIGIAVRYSLKHDSSETRWGDVPSPTKKRIKDRSGLNINDLFEDFEPAPIEGMTDDIVIATKCADHIEGILFLGEHRVGRHADVAYEHIVEAANDYLMSIRSDIGDVARQVLSELQNAQYTI